MQIIRSIVVLVGAAMLSGVGYGQSSVPPLPSLPVTYVFSNCEAGVTFRATIEDWLRDANGNIQPLAAMKVVQGTTSVSYSYLFYGRFSMTIGGTTQVSGAPRLPDGSTARPIGAISVLYTNFGIEGVPASTTWMVQAPNAAGLGVGTGASSANLAWLAALYGTGNLMPNGIASPAPPITAWTPINTYINGDGKLLARPITSYGACDQLGLDGKGLGIPLCACGDPINAATGNLFEQVADYRSFGANKLTFERYYNSQAAGTVGSMLGSNWRSNYDRYLRLAGGAVMAERGDGRQLVFTQTAGVWTPDSDVGIRLTNSGTTWTLTNLDDSVETYTMGTANLALLRTVKARNGYTQTLQYDPANNLTAVTDSYNRSLTFTYDNGLVSTVTTPDGLTLSYGYSTAGSRNRLTTVTYSTAPATTLTYLYENSAFSGALTGIVDENGNRAATWTYDSTGRATSSQQGAGAGLTRVAYNADGSRTVTYPLGAQLTYKFATLQNVAKLTEISRAAAPNVAAGTRKFTYDANGYLASQTDWNGNLTTYVNDTRGQQTTVVTASGTPLARTVTMAYHATLHLPVRIVEPGVTTTFTYDALGNLLTRTRTDTTTATVPYSTAGQARTYTYTWSNFLLESMKNPRTDVAAVTKLAYDSSGALTAVTNALGQVVKITESLPGGWPVTMVDRNGVVTRITYDPRLRITSITRNADANPTTTTFAYDAVGNLTSVTGPDGSAVTNTYDAARRLTAVTDLFNQTTAYGLDAMGDRIQSDVRDGDGNRRHYSSAQFDALGRLRQQIGGAGQATVFDYDANGNVVTVTAPVGRVTQQAFDARNRRTRITDAAKGVTTLTYDALDRPLTVVDPNGATTTYTYNGFGDVIQRVSPDSGTTVYRYDANGNVTQRVNADGVTVNYTYDALDRMKTTSYPAKAAENVTFAYDEDGHGTGVGRLTTMTDAAGTLSRTYDERGNVVSETRTIGDATFRTGYAYDTANRLATITYPSGYSVAYARDAMGRISGIAAAGAGSDTAVPVLSDVAYLPFGPVTSMTYGNGITEQRSFDADLRLTKIESAVESLAYSYNAADNVTAIADGLVGGNSQTLEYDAMNRLTKAGGGYGAIEYAYDTAGNRTAQTRGGVRTTYAYTARSNQMTAATVGGVRQAVAYTKSGNVNGFVSPAGAAMTLAYNQAGRLESAAANGAMVAQYTYDGMAQRVKKAGSQTTLYHYGVNRRLLEQTDEQGNAIADYVYVGDVPVAVIAPATGQISFLHNDRLGAPQTATDAGQNAVWAANYTPFGELDTTPMNIVQDLRLPGQEFDAETGLYHNGFRDYAPGWGRYVQTDPIGLLGGINTYAYAGGNPIGAIDPMGLDELPASGQLGLDANTVSGLFVDVADTFNKKVEPIELAKDFAEGYTASDAEIKNFIASGGFQNPCEFSIAKAVGIEIQLLQSLMKGDPVPFDISRYDYSEGYSKDTLRSIALKSTDPLARAAALYQLQRQTTGNMNIFDSNGVLLGSIRLQNDPPAPATPGTITPVVGPFIGSAGSNW